MTQLWRGSERKRKTENIISKSPKMYTTQVNFVFINAKEQHKNVVLRIFLYFILKHWFKDAQAMKQ